MLITLFIIMGIILGILSFDFSRRYYCSLQRKRILKTPKKRLNYLMG